MKTLCRLCGKVNINSINVLDSSNENLKLQIYNLLRIEIHQSDFLPTKVCTSCVTAVKEASTFVNCCHHVQKILKQKYEADHLNPKGAELVSKTNGSNVLIPSEIGGNKENTTDEEHSIILGTEHSIFVTEPKKLTFVDPDELTSEVTFDPLHYELASANKNSRLLQTSSNILVENEAESNVKIIQNEPKASQFGISGMPHSSVSIKEEELPTIKSEAIEIDECFAPDPLEMETNETYVPDLENFQKNINPEMNVNNDFALNSVLPEPTQNAFSAIQINDGRIRVKDPNCLLNASHFPTKSIDNSQDIVTSTSTSKTDHLQKSARDFASDDEMHVPDTYSISNATDENEITPTSAGPSRVHLKYSTLSTLMSALAPDKEFPLEKVDVGKQFEGVGKGKQLIMQDAWKNYFETNSFRRECNVFVPRANRQNAFLKTIKTPSGPAARDDGGTSTESDPKKLYDYCMQVAKQINLKNYVGKSLADCRVSERLITSTVPQSQPQNKSTNLSFSTASPDPTPTQDGGPQDSSVANKNRTFFKCETCGKKFLSKSLYDDHLNVHTGDRPFTCEICSKTYRRRYDLNVHNRIIHARGEFKCSLCDYVAAYEGRLKVHLKTSHEKPFCCSICNYRCGTKRRMEEHIVNKHQSDEHYPPEVCELCGGSFKGKLSLRAHQQKVHYPEPQVCSTCGKRCPNQSVYKTHLTQCGKEKIRYTCDMCGRTYSKKAVLKEHMNKHLNIKPYECKLCNKQFFLRVRLLTHMSVHRAPTFQCEVCCKSFNRKDNMKSHMKKHFETEGT